MAKEAANDDGWTHVARGKGRRAAPPAPGLNPPLPDCSVSQIQDVFHAATRKWMVSTCRTEVLEILDRKKPDDGWQISKVVCLASGSFSRSNWQSRQRSMLQFAALVDIIEHLETDSELESRDKIARFAQDPQYTAVDTEFLGCYGFTVLQSALSAVGKAELGLAAQHVSPASFVFEPFMDVSTEAVAELCAGDPALYIGSSIHRNLTAKSKAAADFMRARGSYRMPAFTEDPNVFEGLAIWWKEPVADDDRAD
ncbi:hypothetical protein BAUCODRAFT_150257 [Baudoinia panamericana UAMH 10762]|uniref:SRR1-like domain-containing protein n=1 Tax=Baudoinia panamericana (strain UAMH 10762) TaxID=717646 RepID=M2N4V0_BAUPA|nr:uncharacterized protein BAUCODRAFT_150257 [Baudoinia panamericana UAMH 10762]EMC94034.1 hypothetical protein BAUCODRAFT_150257 [Baudoinia panamericana UAMH 10762]